MLAATELRHAGQSVQRRLAEAPGLPPTSRSDSSAANWACTAGAERVRTQAREDCTLGTSLRTRHVFSAQQRHQSVQKDRIGALQPVGGGRLSVVARLKRRQQPPPYQASSCCSAVRSPSAVDLAAVMNASWRSCVAKNCCSCRHAATTADCDDKLLSAWLRTGVAAAGCGSHLILALDALQQTADVVELAPRAQLRGQRQHVRNISLPRPAGATALPFERRHARFYDM